MLRYDLKDDIIYKINKFLKHYIIDNMYLTNFFTNSYFYSIKSVRERMPKKSVIWKIMNIIKKSLVAPNKILIIRETLIMVQIDYYH